MKNKKWFPYGHCNVEWCEEPEHYQNNYWDNLIESYKVEKEHRFWFMFTDFCLDVFIRILIVVAIGLVIIILAK
jgi:hypothetical protein